MSEAGISADETHGRILLFVPDMGETSTIKRAEQFAARGLAVTVLGFRRQRYHRDFEPPWPFLSLGRTHDGRYGQRLGAMAKAIRILAAHRRELAAATALYARNMDQLVLALATRRLLRRRVPVVYEVLDIPLIMVRRGPVSWAMRWAERFALRRVRLLVVSSPAFHAQYFAAVQRHAGEWLLVENKLNRAPAFRSAAAARAAPHRGRYRWRIGYFGLIRGAATFALMCRVARRFPDVQFRFRGVLTTVDEGEFRAALERHPNIVFEGGYDNPRDLAQLYGGVDFAWAIDLEHADHNSRWLLPCRFYEAGFFGVPCLAARGFEFGDLVDLLGAGWTFGAPFEEELARFLGTVTPEEVAAVRNRLLSLPMTTFVAGPEIDELCRRLGAPWTRKAAVASAGATAATIGAAREESSVS
jgi:succinoglycan biosynthesis protein ExoL